MSSSFIFSLQPLMFNLTNANQTELQKSTSSFFFWWRPDPELGTERQCVLWQAPNYLEMSVYHKGCWCSVSGTIRHTLALLNFIHPPAWMWPHGNLSRISRCFHTSLSPLRCRRQKTCLVASGLVPFMGPQQMNGSGTYVGEGIICTVPPFQTFGSHAA